MENRYTIEDLNNILIEDNELQKILYPHINPEENNEKFEGKIFNNEYKKGIYRWKNGQVFFGNLTNDNKFIKKGKIKFPNNDELVGTFNENNNTIINATYINSNRKYQGSFKKNKLDGKFIIKNNDNNEHYLYIGSYYNGVKHGKFTLEKIYNNRKIKVSGVFDKGKKNGIFKIFEIGDSEINLIENEVYTQEFKKDIIISNLIENKQFFNYKSKYKIICMEIYEKNDKIYLLLGSYEYLLIYDIDINLNQIILNKKIFLFKNSEINDIIKLKYDKILLCNNKNCFKLIKLIFEEDKSNNEINNIKQTYIKNDFKLLQEFQGEQNSKNIFCLYLLSNDLIVSGDCENIIVWKINYLNNDNNNNISYKNNYLNNNNNNNNINTFNKQLTSFDTHTSISNIFKDLGNFFNRGKEKEKEIEMEKEIIKQDFFNFKSHIYCMLEINRINNINNNKSINISNSINNRINNNNILLAVAQPDSKSISFLKIQNNEKINENEINTIYKVDSIETRKNIMKDFNDNLFVACKNKIIIIDINKYKIIYDIYTNESITYINNYFDEFLLCGIMKSKEHNNYEGYLSQRIICNKSDKNEEKIMKYISDFEKFIFEGNIINSCKYNSNFNNREYIITIGTKGEILIIL